MVDINKYLESQLALAKKRNVRKDSNDKKLVSQKSKSAAERIAQKQDRTLPKGSSQTSSKSDADALNPCNPTVSTRRQSQSDDEYFPSCDEEDDEVQAREPSSSRGKHNLKKTVDDGDNKLYNERVSNWRNSLSLAKSKMFDGNYYSADIQYVLEEKGDPEEDHEHEDLRIPAYIWKQLYKYQRTGVKWLWELHQIESGGMLGDEMGLGKTVQIIGFLAGLFKTDSGAWGGLGPSIIVAPATVIYQWVSHFHFWCPPLRVAVLHHTGSHHGNHNKLIRDIYDAHGILLISYAGIVKYTKDLLSKKWHYLILDEGHKIRNPDTQVSKLVKNFQTPHKLLITGSPMQNSLQELWSLFDFMRPGLLGTYNAFMDHFAVPITQGGYANATELQEATALEIAKALKNMIAPYMLRRTKAEVQDHIKLPEKNEQVLFCALSNEQRDLYMGYLMSRIVRSILDKDNKYEGPLRARVLVALSTLRKICNHPDLYLYEVQDESEEIGEEFGHWKRSGKMSVVHSLLKIWSKQGHRTLIFTQSRAMVCILEQHLQKHDFKYLKMDGTVTVSQRQNLIKTFNENEEYLVFLSTTRVGGLGVNLTGADRVILYDPDWNPATDNQAKERAWRIGQQKNVTVYRLLSAGTIEEKIYQRQIFKNFLSNKILVDPNQKNVLSPSTLQGLFTLEDLNCDGDTETASLFKHTKVELTTKKKKHDKINLSSDLSFSKRKLNEMRKRAKEISKKISKSNAIKNIVKPPGEDPREKYKKTREMFLTPPAPPADSDINLIDGKMTNEPFQNILSEIDIINKHTKKDYEENLIREVLNSQSTEVEGVDSNHNNKLLTDGISDVKNVADQNKTMLVEEIDNSSNLEKKSSNLVDGNPKKENILELTVTTTCKIDEVETPRKRKHSPSPEPNIECLIGVEKVKKKKHKKTREKKLNDDDYVLSKLFAKATVKNALQHDIVIGLAEKEKRHRMKEEATKNARKALRAIKISTK